MHSLTHTKLTKVAWDDGNSPSIRPSVVDVMWDESTFFPIFSLFSFSPHQTRMRRKWAHSHREKSKRQVGQPWQMANANGQCKRTKGNENSTRREKLGVRRNSPLDSNVVQVFPPLLIQSAVSWKKKEMKRNSTCVHVLMYPCIHVLSLFSGTGTKMEQRHL